MPRRAVWVRRLCGGNRASARTIELPVVRVHESPLERPQPICPFGPGTSFRASAPRNRCRHEGHLGDRRRRFGNFGDVIESRARRRAVAFFRALGRVAAVEAAPGAGPRSIRETLSPGL